MNAGITDIAHGHFTMRYK